MLGIFQKNSLQENGSSKDLDPALMDISEKTDLAKSNPAKVRELRDLLHAWQKETGAKFPSPNPSYDASK